MKAIVSVIGTDKPGIIAKVSTCLFNFNVNIEDISQTIMQNNFTMIMFVDLSRASIKFEDLSIALEKIGTEIGMLIRIQDSGIFQAMHRI
ncbi:MAG: ACT domain-containing protein [Elusimicrobiota bacterium]|jgi:ACT domain-containing protein|nr:ACT domain-containing protein [Elusimicrobiota bacterium]